MVKKSIHVVLLIVTWHLCSVAASADEPNPADSLAKLIQRAGEVKIEAYSEDEYSAAATTYHELLKELEALDLKELEGDDAIDADLLAAHLKDPGL